MEMGRGSARLQDPILVCRAQSGLQISPTPLIYLWDQKVEYHYSKNLGQACSTFGPWTRCGPWSFGIWLVGLATVGKCGGRGAVAIRPPFPASEFPSPLQWVRSRQYSLPSWPEPCLLPQQGPGPCPLPLHSSTPIPVAGRGPAIPALGARLGTLAGSNPHIDWALPIQPTRQKCWGPLS